MGDAQLKLRHGVGGKLALENDACGDAHGGAYMVVDHPGKLHEVGPRLGRPHAWDDVLLVRHAEHARRQLGRDGRIARGGVHRPARSVGGLDAVEDLAQPHREAERLGALRIVVGVRSRLDGARLGVEEKICQQPAQF